jgi:hypothetical protein
VSSEAQALRMFQMYRQRWGVEMRQPHYPHTRRVPLVVHPA